jgi:hypothetical protein
LAGGNVDLIGASLSPSGTMLDPSLLAGRGITVGAIGGGSRAGFERMNRAGDRSASVALRNRPSRLAAA